MVTTTSCDYQILVRLIDEALLELGVQVLVDGRKARDQLLELRTMCNVLEVGWLESQ